MGKNNAPSKASHSTAGSVRGPSNPKPPGNTAKRWKPLLLDAEDPKSRTKAPTSRRETQGPENSPMVIWLEKGMKTLTSEHEVLEAQMSLLRSRVDNLHATRDQYEEEQHRTNPYPSPFPTLKLHGADAASDALLFLLTNANANTNGPREDISPFKEIYYFTPAKIRDVDARNDTLSLYVINRRAALLRLTLIPIINTSASTSTSTFTTEHLTIAPIEIDPARVELEAAFLAFVRVMQDFWGENVDLADEGAALTRAYWRFGRAYEGVMRGMAWWRVGGGR